MTGSDAHHSPEYQAHTAACLDGARKTIDLLYQAYTHRHYFRTWYYNSTYTLYASMLVLYAILINYQPVSRVDLIHDVEKSLEILRAIEHITVAKRCAFLIREVLEVAERQQKSDEAVNSQKDKGRDVMDETTYDGDDRSSGDNWAQGLLQSATPHLMYTHNGFGDLPVRRDFNEPTDTSRNNLLASLMDPVVLEDFATDLYADQDLDFNIDWTGLDSGAWMNLASLPDL